MDLIYSGKELKSLITESIPGYKPLIGGDASAKNAEINKKANKDSIKNVELKIDGEEQKPKVYSKQNSDLGNNKNMLDLEFSHDPGEEWRKKVKKEVVGDGKEESGNEGNSDFFDAAKKASSVTVDNDHKLKTTGLVSKFIPMGKKETAFEGDNRKMKRLNFKNTKFLSESHMFSLIPEDYKKSGSKFIMKDASCNEYLIAWKIDETNKISEGVIVNHSNKKKLSEEFERMRNLYSYTSKDNFGTLNGNARISEDGEIQKGLDRLREVSNN